jgi:hypothetical protein
VISSGPISAAAGQSTISGSAFSNTVSSLIISGTSQVPANKAWVLVGSFSDIIVFNSNGTLNQDFAITGFRFNFTSSGTNQGGFLMSGNYTNLSVAFTYGLRSFSGASVSNVFVFANGTYVVVEVDD